MDEFKPEDELKPDPSDRRTGRSRQSSERDNEPQINFDDVDLDADDRRPARARKERDEEQDIEEEYESDDDTVDEERVERRPRKRKKAASKPASRQYMMMGVGVLVLLLLIIGIGSALKAPHLLPMSRQHLVRRASISGSNATDQASATPPATGAEQTAGNTQQDVSLPPISSTPTQGQAPAATEGQQRVEVQGDLNNALTQPQGGEQVNNAVVNSTLPTEPATVAPMRNGSAARQTAKTETTERPAATHQERKQAVIEPKSKPQTTVKATPTEPKPVARAKPTATAPTTTTKAPVVTATPKATAEPKATTTAPAQTATPAPTATATTTTPVAGGAKSAGNVGALKSAPSSHYTLQLSSSSNYDNLNGWAKKENLKNYVVYQTTRNGQPWYVLVTGVYASKEDAKRAVSTLPADIQAKTRGQNRCTVFRPI